jgi:WD40 repeat protein
LAPPRVASRGFVAMPFWSRFSDEAWSIMTRMGAERSRSAARGSLSLPSLWLAAGALAAAAAGCGDPPPGRTFYQRNIEPILQQKCAGNTSGCHSTNPGDAYQFAAGNFDVTSFDNVQKRRDVLTPFGAYAYPLLLIKAAPTGSLSLYYDTKVAGIDPKVSPSRPLEVQHSGGPILDVNSDAFIALHNWLDNGATENGLKPPTPPQTGNGSCSDSIPSGFSKATYVKPATQASFDAFRTTVQPILTQHGCTAGSCHGAPQSDFYITCGTTDDEVAFNFSQAWSFVNTPVEDSQILRIPLAVGQGGRGHTGGDQFASTTAADYLAIRAWAMQAGVLDFANGDPGKQFFASYVQPILLARGCSFSACHSPAATNDFKLRSGTQGFFSAVALEKNYELLKTEFMAIEFPDARRGRAVAKALISNGDSALGIAHRGGPLLEDPVPRMPCNIDPAKPLLDPQDFSPLCIVQTWLDLERKNLGTQVTAMAATDPVTVVYVQRSTAALDGDPLAFDTFAGGAQLRRGDATFGPGQQIKLPFTTAQIALDSCGLAAGGDIRGPDVAPDGDHVVFAARAAASDGLGVYLIKLSAPGTCVPVTMPGSGKIHNFDPAFSPDGKWIVFASTRGKSGVGPTLSRKRFLPQSDLWRVAVSGDTVDQNSYEQVTFLSNSEVAPHFMREGRITMTTEKVSDGFYQLSGRRINWDRTDYHPLLAQRAISPYASLTDLTQTKPSIGYASATQIREGSDGSFLVILSDLNPDGTPVAPGRGGALGIFNRSIGPFEQGRSDIGYLPALRIVGATATGRAGSPASYRSPVSLPSGDIMASFASAASTGNFDIVAVNPHSGAQTTLIAAPAGSALVDAVLVYKYPPRALYENRRQLVFGGSDTGDPAHAVLHMPDAPMVFTLLTGNLRRGRPVDAFRKAKFLAVYGEGLCPAGPCGANINGIYQNRQLLGTASLADDGSVRVQLPSGTGVVLELQDDKHNTVVKMTEEHQLGPGEQISMGIVQPLFDAVCAGCHGSVTGHEVDVRVSPDALTGASASISATKPPQTIP